MFYHKGVIAFFDMNPKDYDYVLPEKNLALRPATPRDTSRLFIYNCATDRVFFDYFYNLSKYLPEKSFLVLNDTKVLPARVTMKKESGGKAIVLFLVNEIVGDMIPVIVDRKIIAGEKIYFDKENFLEIISQDENIFKLKFSFDKKKLFSLLKKYGAMPIPPYLKKTDLKRDELIEKYQTIFAKREGSAAAPTASLHFTEKVKDSLIKKGIEQYFVTLHVGLGTFAPLTEENINTKKLHEEYYEVDRNCFDLIKKAKEDGKKLVSVGTTVTRTLESLAKSKKLIGSTDLFIFPPYNFKMVDILITNFHLPESSLMMLVESFLQYKRAKRSLVELYRLAIANNFRFYSFGDAMLIL